MHQIPSLNRILCLVAAMAIIHSVQAAPAVSWEISSRCDKEIFPSLLISTASMESEKEELEENELGDSDSTIGIQLTSPAKRGATVEIKIRANRVMEESTFTGTLSRADTDYDIFPQINWKYDELIKVKQAEPLTVVFDLSINGVSQGSRSLTVRLHSVNECPFYLYGDEEDGSDDTDLTFLFAAYVNEDHPWIDNILKQALQTGIVDSFDGYQSGDPEKVYLQVFAIWKVLQNLGFRYSNITTLGIKTEKMESQHVRFLDESVKARQANCVDGSVLFASVLRKIGLDTFLVTIPEHMFVGFYLDEDATKPVGLETTMLGDKQNVFAKELDGISAKTNARLKEDASFSAFETAIQSATKDLKSNKKKFDKENQPDYRIVSIEESRNIGILPLTYVRGGVDSQREQGQVKQPPAR
ncbi:MAG: hypothetical protein ABI615_14040 [Chthoniobacterales bacterium]